MRSTKWLAHTFLGLTSTIKFATKSPTPCARSTLAPPFRFSLVPARAPGLEVSVVLVRQLKGEKKRRPARKRVFLEKTLNPKRE